MWAWAARGGCGAQVISAGADGLVKLWSLGSDECVSTFDEHQGKIWAMTVGGGPAQGTVVTGAWAPLRGAPASACWAAEWHGLQASWKRVQQRTSVGVCARGRGGCAAGRRAGGSDACVCVWEDVTAADAEAAEQAAEELLGKEQDLANALAVRALGLSHAGPLPALFYACRTPSRVLLVRDDCSHERSPTPRFCGVRCGAGGRLCRRRQAGFCAAAPGASAGRGAAGCGGRGGRGRHGGGAGADVHGGGGGAAHAQAAGQPGERDGARWTSCDGTGGRERAAEARQRTFGPSFVCVAWARSSGARSFQARRAHTWPFARPRDARRLFRCAT